jgi:RNA polymerase sigma-70 factor (ECF subfamily)
MSTGFKQSLTEAIPMLRAFARALSGNPDRADDLVQETLVKAIAHRDKFRTGTNLHAWLVTILRNQYYSEGRRRRREVPDPDGFHAGRLTDGPRQDGAIAMQDFLCALQCLPCDHREALLLIGVSDLSYEEAAKVLGAPVGTIKSRVSRARARLEALVNGSPDFRRDPAAALQSLAQLDRALSLSA